jgi:hypothetical protein
MMRGDTKVAMLEGAVSPFSRERGKEVVLQFSGASLVIEKK